MSNEEEFNFWKTFEEKVSIRENEIVISNVVFPKISKKILINETKKNIETSPFNKDYLEKDIFFINCKFHDFTLDKIKFNKKIIFDNCKFLNDINFKNITFNEELGIYDCTFFDVNLNINSQTTFNEGFRIADNKGKLNIKFNLVYLNRGDFSIFANKNLELFNLEISSCFIYHESYFEIIGNIMSKLKLNDVKNYSHDFLIQHTTIKEEFILVDCRFNNTRFYNLDLVNCLVNVSGITLDNLSINDIKWGKLRNKFRYKYPNGKTKSNRSLFSEFKNSYEKKGNIIQANEFYALEMKEMEKELKFTKRPFEWLVFKTHSLASNHSQEWLLALFWIINLTFITTYLSHELFCADIVKHIDKGLVFFGGLLLVGVIISKFNEFYRNIAIIISTICIYLFYSKSYFDDSNLKEFSNMINPFSIMTKGEELSFGTLIYKIIIAYLIYQLIVSIRQNTRRK